MKVIANPPAGIYNGDLPLGYAYYHTLLDIHARFLNNLGEDVVCHKYSLNALGKRAENLGLNIPLEDHVRNMIEEGQLRDKLNLSFEGEILDCVPESMEKSQEVLVELDKKGYIIRSGDETYLNVGKISSEKDLEGVVEKINFFPGRAKSEFLRMIRKSSDAIKISKPRKYAASNPLGGENISPIFTVANMWEAYFDNEIDFMSCSEKEIARYLLLRFYSQTGISDKLPMKNVFIFNRINPEGGFGEWDMDKLLQDGSDPLRYTFAKSLSFSRQSVDVKKGLLDGGKKFVNLVDNLGTFFQNNGFSERNIAFCEDEKYISDMNGFRFNKVLSGLERDFRQLSREINKSRQGGKLYPFVDSFFRKYSDLVAKLSPFCPGICNDS
ncbi:hypothetical protein HOG16_02630 [Candidatus Woesearchaeota archaeon]|jgi:hypothetical protein|nr:hypothetical protein [Candidatus Woesearchaeota archaeon]MBT4321993.1 hypothetical protein [Candidatus Woesearchaeota archaeon]MBT4630739.1 hypothetical protein [Candidatus Woesearchaeota archaeon]